MNSTRFRLLLTAALFAMALVGPAALPVAAASGTRYVSPAGNDTGSDCLDKTVPCKTINYAISQAVAGEEIRVEAGDYQAADQSPNIAQGILIDKDVLISGGWDNLFTMQPGGSTIRGSEAGRVLTIPANVRTTVIRVEITGGRSDFGGGIHIEAGAHLNLTNAIVFANEVTQAGGGIFVDGSLSLESSTVNNNIALDGGGIYANHSDVNVTGSMIAGNIAKRNGGGLVQWGGVLAIERSQISQNYTATTGVQQGGGMYFDGSPQVSLTNVVMTNNTVGTYGVGGHIYVVNGDVILNSVTIHEGGAGGGAGGIQNDQGAVTLSNTIIAKMTAGGGMCAGEVDSAGYNILEYDDGCTFYVKLTDSRGSLGAGLDPKIDASTGELLSGSPAIDKGNPAGLGSGGSACPGDDVNGADRTAHAPCDIGAFEYGSNVKPAPPGHNWDDTPVEYTKAVVAPELAPEPAAAPGLFSTTTLFLVGGGLGLALLLVVVVAAVVAIRRRQ